MFRKFVCLISFVLVFMLAGNVSAQYEWDGGGSSMLWSEAENWEPDGVPTQDDTVQINIEDANCLIDSSVNAQCAAVTVGASAGPCYLHMTGGTLTTYSSAIQVGNSRDANSYIIIDGGVATSGPEGSQGSSSRLWIGMNGNGILIMNGGELYSYNKVEIGKNASGVGEMYIYGGTVTFAGEPTGNDLEIGKYGTGSVYMYGGELNIEDYIKLAQGSESQTDGAGSMYLYGGVVNAGNLRNPADGIYGTPLMDITEGTLTLPGDYSEIVNQYIDNGWMIAYDDFGVVNVDYDVDANQTIITATPLDPRLAQKPTPKNGAVEVARDAVLSWMAGIYSYTHNVYFGTDANDVNEATVDDPRGVLVGQSLTNASYTPDNILDFGQTYYWRVDEVNDLDPNSPWKGKLWNFTVVNYVVVDDFEDYNDYPPNEIWNTWIDGYGIPTNGATAGYPNPDFVAGEHYMEDDIVHSGLLSMPVFYDNSVGISEVTRTFTSSTMKNFTREGVVTLTLFYYGVEDNDAEQMYVALNGNAVVNNEDRNAALVTEWTQWNIPLQEFADQGVNLSNVNSMTIGFGNKANPTAGGQGHVFFDDIRLYRP
jgi:hypothetical protein